MTPDQAAIVPPPQLAPRRAVVTGKLTADPALRHALDVQAHADVSVVFAVRTSGGIVTGELRAPCERFDLHLFQAYWDAQVRPS